MNEKLPPDALIEAALLTQTEPLNEKSMRELCVPPLSQDKLIDVLAQLKTRWQGRALQLVHTHEGWRFQIAQAAFERLGSLQEQRAPRYSRCDGNAGDYCLPAVGYARRHRGHTRRGGVAERDADFAGQGLD